MDKDEKIGLIFTCPITNNPDNPYNGNCPLKELREIEIKKRIDLWYEKTTEEIYKIVQFHKTCLHNMENL